MKALGSILVLIGLIFVAALINQFVRGPSLPAKTASVVLTNQYPADIPLLQLPDGVSPTHYDVDLVIDPRQESYSGKISIDLDVTIPLDFFFLHGESMEVGMTEFRGTRGTEIVASYEQVHDNGVAKISLSEIVEPGSYRLVIDFKTAFNSRLDGLYRLDHEGEAYAFSQMQAIAARRVFPCFDEPRFKTPFDVTITTPPMIEAVTNGAEVSSSMNDEDLLVHVYLETKPIPTALLAFAVGPLDIIEWEAVLPTTQRDRPLPLRGVATKGSGGKLSYILETTEPLIHYFEDYFDMPFPYAKLDLVAVPDFDAGAMENVGAIFYQDIYSFADEMTSPSDLADIVDTNAHEIAHMWFGNLVTPKFWDDIWLNESFATWISVKASHQFAPNWKFNEWTQTAALGAMRDDNYVSTRQLRQPIREHDDIMNIWDSISYEKGAGVLNMFEAYLGEDGFREGVRSHMERFAHGVADAEDFVISLAEGSRQPMVADALKTFLYQPGVPLLNIEMTCDESGASLVVSQQRYLPLGSLGDRKREWAVPICYRTDQGDDCALLTQHQERLSLGATCPAFFMPNTNANGYYLWSLDDDALEKLTHNLNELNGLEKMSILKNLEASYKAGQTRGDAVIRLARVLAGDADASVVVSALELLTALDDFWRETDNRPDFKALYKDIFTERFSALGLEPTTESDERDAQGTAELRRDLISVFAFRVEDPSLRATLWEQGIALTGYDDDEVLALEEVPVTLQSFALAVTHQEEGPGFGELLIKHLDATGDGNFRRSLRFGLSRANNPDYAMRLANRLFRSTQLRSNETQSFAYQILNNRALQSAFIEWLQTEDHLALITSRQSNEGAWLVLTYGQYICDAEGREDYFAFMSKAAGDIGGAPRILSQVGEQIDQCIAIRAALAAQ